VDGQVTQNRDEGKQPTSKKGMSVFLKALLWTAIPLLVVSAVSAGTALARGPSGFGTGVAGMLFGLAILACIGSAIARKRQTALGVLAGAAIGLVGLSLTCFTLLSRPATPP